MKMPVRILSVLFSIILCAALASCTDRQDEYLIESLPEPPTIIRTTTEPPTEPSTEESTTEETTTEPTTARPTVTRAPTTAKPTTTTPKSTSRWQRLLPQRPETTAAPIAEYEAEALRLTNAARQRAGLSTLGTSAELQQYADIRAKEIKQEFSHTRPNGESCFSLNPTFIMGENIACGQKTPQIVVDGWIESEEHRENIMRERFTLCAVGCYYDADTDIYYWAQLFA